MDDNFKLNCTPSFYGPLLKALPKVGEGGAYVWTLLQPKWFRILMSHYPLVSLITNTHLNFFSELHLGCLSFSIKNILINSVPFVHFSGHQCNVSGDEAKLTWQKQGKNRKGGNLFIVINVVCMVDCSIDDDDNYRCCCCQCTPKCITS